MKLFHFISSRPASSSCLMAAECVAESYYEDTSKHSKFLLELICATWCRSNFEQRLDAHDLSSRKPNETTGNCMDETGLVVPIWCSIVAKWFLIFVDFESGMCFCTKVSLLYRSGEVASASSHPSVIDPNGIINLEFPLGAMLATSIVYELRYF